MERNEGSYGQDWLGIGKFIEQFGQETIFSQQHSLQILLIAVLTLSVSPKHDLNSLINSSKLLDNEDLFSDNGANHAKVVPLSSVPNSPARIGGISRRIQLNQTYLIKKSFKL